MSSSGASDYQQLKGPATCPKVGPTPDPVTPANRVDRNDDNPDAGTLVEPIRLTFDDEEVVKARTDGKGVEEKKEEDLQNPYKEVLKSPFTRRIIEFSAPSHRMPTDLKIYDGSTDPDDHITRFVGAANQGEWQMPVWFALRRKCCKDPTKVSKIIRKANETLPDFKESWTEE
ncbi:hypothetical protein Tco_1434051 [Tanacetum coccineum]